MLLIIIYVYLSICVVQELRRREFEVMDNEEEDMFSSTTCEMNTLPDCITERYWLWNKRGNNGLLLVTIFIACFFYIMVEFMVTVLIYGLISDYVDPSSEWYHSWGHAFAIFIMLETVILTIVIIIFFIKVQLQTSTQLKSLRKMTGSKLNDIALEELAELQRESVVSKREKESRIEAEKREFAKKVEEAVNNQKKKKEEVQKDEKKKKKKKQKEKKPEESEEIVDPEMDIKQS